MPILNPQQAFNLLVFEIESINIDNDFLKKLLLTASKNYKLNRKTLDVYNKFLNFISLNMDIFFENFNLSDDDAQYFENLDENNIYSIIYQLLMAGHANPNQNISDSDNTDYSDYTQLSEFTGYSDTTIVSNISESNYSESEDSESDDSESEDSESDNKESDNKKLDIKESDIKESNNNESENNESENKESNNKESNNKESDIRESNNKESDIRESNNNESGNKELNNNELENKESNNNESENKESNNINIQLDTQSKIKNNYCLIELDFAGYLKEKFEKAEIIIPDIKSLFFIPFHGKSFGLYVSTDSYAVLAFHNNKVNEKDLFLLGLAALLLEASGYIIVACILDDENTYYQIPEVLEFNTFGETHIFAEITKYKESDYRKMDISCSKNGYVYLYAHFRYNAEKFQELLEQESNANLKIFIFSKKIYSKRFRKVNYYIPKEYPLFYAPKSVRKTRDFKDLDSFNLSGFEKHTIGINLCNVALYKPKPKNDITPTKISGIGYGSIDSSFFLTIKDSLKVSIKVYNEDLLVDFRDLHYMNPELYIAEPMYLSKKNIDISIVEKIINTYQDYTTISERIKSKKSDIKLNIEEKLRHAFHYLYKFTKDENDNNIEPYTSQIYAVYQAISYLSEKPENEKGIILQVHTGEGKSFIVQVLAEYLARQGNTVHIATSNIILAARDFMKSYKYFTECERKASKLSKKRPSILIHKEEKKFIDRFIKGRISDDVPEKDIFYNDSNFDNPTNMNIVVCENNKRFQSNIVYSTFLNFEAYYLHQKEKNPYDVSNYLKNCYLIIDEADSILVDELTNGTILSKPMKSNADEVLELVYSNYMSGNKNPEHIQSMIKFQFPECENIQVDHIKKMFLEIEKVTSKGFDIDRKYVIAEDPSNPNIKRVYPFDSENKGIVELNKEFNGYVHQFVGIKEKHNNPIENENLEIQPLSLNYQFISHPTYVQMYKSVCGVTGTVGSDREKGILEKYYKLTTANVPRHQMNLGKNLPMILCDNNKDRDRIIIQELLHFHNDNYPVLVVFIDVKEIRYFKDILINEKKIEHDKLYIFDGKNKKSKKLNKEDKMKIENESGKSGIITLGTNFCGRGIDIKFQEKPLCVIVTYYKDDKRSIDQVIGRAGRNGRPGITRIICTKKMYNEGFKTPKEDAMHAIISEFDIKNNEQTKYIKKINKKYPWIFNDADFTAKISKKDALSLRECSLNVNRITAFKYKFPVGMSYETFLKIQIQRIFSLKNCPECKYTWYLFRTYMRELILESWSLFLDDVDLKFNAMKNEEEKDDKTIKSEYSKFFTNEKKKFDNVLYQYIPQKDKCSYFETFLFIFNKAQKDWENEITEKIKYYNKYSEIEAKSNSYTSINFGFFPMCLSENSGCRLTPLTPEEQEKSDKGCLYIVDPELRYIKKRSKKIFSITVAVDKIFEKFQEIADEKLQGLFGIRFFLRRTLCGCEFGVCVETNLEYPDDLQNCLFDRTPLLMFTLCTKSSFVWLGGLLIIVLVFFTSVAVTIGKKIIDSPNVTSHAWNFIKKIFFKIITKEEEGRNSIVVEHINKALEKIITFLDDEIRSSLDEHFEDKMKFIFKEILDLLKNGKIDKIDERINSQIGSNIRINAKIRGFLSSDMPYGKLIKIGVLIILYIAVFVFKFKHKKGINFKKVSRENASTFQKQNKQKKELDITKYNAYIKICKKIDNAEYKRYDNENSDSDSDSFFDSSS